MIVIAKGQAEKVDKPVKDEKASEEKASKAKKSEK